MVGLSVHFTQSSNIEDQNGKQMATMVNKGSIFRLKAPKERVYYSAKVANLWHQRFGYLNDRSAKILSERMAEGIPFKYIGKSKYIACIKGKHHRTLFLKEGKRAREMLKLISSDLCGPMEMLSLAR